MPEALPCRVIRSGRRSRWGRWSLILAGWAVAARAETIIKSHGISTFGELKYPPDFKHFDYVNPDAPKGGG